MVNHSIEMISVFVKVLYIRAAVHRVSQTHPTFGLL